jgi:hypothetical protein
MVDWLRGARAVLDGKARYPGTIVLRIDDDGHQCDVVGPRRALPGTTVRWDVLIDSRRSAPAIISTNGFAHQVPPGGAAVAQLRLTAGNTHGSLRIDREAINVDRLLTVVPAGELTVTSDRVIRWSVVDEQNDGWFPEGALQKWDNHSRPYFHARRARLAVPAGTTLTVTAGAGLEFERTGTTVTVDAMVADVELTPQRRIDPAADGWFGGDMHVHMNYSGEQVCSPHHAALMQCGEGLRRNLVAGNLATSRIMDEGPSGPGWERRSRGATSTTSPRWASSIATTSSATSTPLAHGRAEPVLHRTPGLDHPVDHPANAVPRRNFRISERLSVTAIQSSR